MASNRLNLIISVIVLSIGICLALFGRFRSYRVPYGFHVGELLPLPNELSGWVRTEEQIASSPEMKRMVNELLNYDDASFVNYIRGAERVSIYIAYWRPGRMSQRLVAGHTPDVCWVGIGWEARERKSRVVLVPREGDALQPAEWREMRLGSVSEHVLYWHLVGGQSRDLSVPIAPWYSFFFEVLSKGMNQRDEQFFIRISSERKDAGWDTEVVEKLVSRLRAKSVPI